MVINNTGTAMHKREIGFFKGSSNNVANLVDYGQNSFYHTNANSKEATGVSNFSNLYLAEIELR